MLILVTKDGGDNAPEEFVGVYKSWEALLEILRGTSDHFKWHYSPSIYNIPKLIELIETRGSKNYFGFESFTICEYKVIGES